MLYLPVAIYIRAGCVCKEYEIQTLYFIFLKPIHSSSADGHQQGIGWAGRVIICIVQPGIYSALNITAICNFKLSGNI
jgi:hypothetical protein